MPCTTRRLTPEQTLQQRMEQVRRALKQLEQKLLGSTARVVIGANGAITFAGWTPQERSGITDVCAYRTLASENSWALRQAIARAEMQSGRKVNPQAIAAGHHSHDGGRTWSTH